MLSLSKHKCKGLARILRQALYYTPHIKKEQLHKQLLFFYVETQHLRLLF